MDDWRVQQTWRLLQGKRTYHTTACRVGWWILWRRIAGGLTSGQQRQLAEPILGELRALFGGMSKAGKRRRPALGDGPHETAEVWRLLGSFELLPIAVKIDLANTLLAFVAREESSAVRDACVWTLGRLAARVPMYAPLNSVVPADDAAHLVRVICELGLSDNSAAFAVVQLVRRTCDRYRDVPELLRVQVLAWLESLSAPSHYRQLVEEVGDLHDEETGLMFGESLPRGLRIG
jgi:hypothetical protein